MLAASSKSIELVSRNMPGYGRIIRMYDDQGMPRLLSVSDCH